MADLSRVSLKGGPILGWGTLELLRHRARCFKNRLRFTDAVITRKM
jgi:hypothetical protein